MQKVLLLHGWGGSDYPHWQSWLASEIAKDYGTVSFLRLKNPDAPKKSEWMHQLKEALEDFKPDIVLCHSLANILWFHLCNEQIDINKVEKLFLVAPPSLKQEIKEVDTFFPIQAPENLFAKQTVLVTSTNDPYMNIQEAKELQKTLDVEMKILTDGGHINADSGYGKWSWILEQIGKK